MTLRLSNIFHDHAEHARRAFSPNNAAISDRRRTPCPGHEDVEAGKMIRRSLLALRFVLTLAAIAILGGSNASAAQSHIPDAASSDAPCSDVTSKRGELWRLDWADVAFTPSRPGAWRRAVQCAEEQKTQRTGQLSRQLSEMLGRNVTLQPGCFDSLECEAILAVERLRSKGWSRSQFRRAREAAFRADESFWFAVEYLDRQISEQAAARRPLPNAQLELRAARDQILRGTGAVVRSVYSQTSSASPLDEVTALMFRLRTISADLDDSQWLQETFLPEKWPRLSTDGHAAVKAAAILAIHSDRSPVVQQRALTAMRQAFEQGDADGPAYATLHDRVALSVDGRQRYGTQLSCEAGKLVAKSLEAPDRTDEYRRSVGLVPLAVFLSRAGSCS
jgi:hypothetical protein